MSQPGTSCSSSKPNAVDVAETCNGSATTCPTDTLVAAGTVCRTSAGPCDVAEACTGSSGSCPADSFAPSTTTCRAAAGRCDVAEKCSGSGASCPADSFVSSGTVCRASAGTCDVAETCSGGSPSCPSDALVAAGTVCRAAAGACDVAEACTGSSSACPTDTFGPPTTTCRASAGACDVAENCSGSAPSCPADGFVASGTVCRASAGACDVAESCSGASAACPTDAFASSATICRASTGQCDPAESCTGGSASCPADGKLANGTTCSNGNSCTADSCQSGTCVSGANTCVALTVEQRPFSIFSSPVISMVTGTDKTTFIPGDALTFTASVTNTGLYYEDRDNVLITNTAASSFTIGSYQQTLEYLSTTSHTWVTVAKVAFDASGTEIDDPNYAVLQVTNLFGSIIPAGGSQELPYRVSATLPPNLAIVMADPTQASAIRTVLSVDVGGSSPAATSNADVSEAFGDDAATAASTQATVAFLEQAGAIDLTLTTPNPAIASGTTAVFTGSLVTRPLPARAAGESDRDYVNRLNLPVYTYFVDAFGPRGVGAQQRVFIPLEVPLLAVTKSGPTQAVAGFTVPYGVQLQNTGNIAASAISITDSVNGTDVAAQVTVPPSIAGGATATATVSAASPVAQAPGAYTDQASVTWQDPNGNVYGPMTSSFTTTLTAGHAEGYLTIAASGVGGPEILGTPAVLTATAIDQFGHPVGNLAVHLAIVGANAQTASLVTGADGTVTFSYDGPKQGQDIATVSATINGPLLQAGTPVLTWASSVGTPCTERATPLDVMMVVDGSPSMFTDNTVLTAQAAADAFIRDLNPNTDQIAGVVFNFDVDLIPLSNNMAAAQTTLNTALQEFTDACSGFCPPDSSDFPNALQAAYQELTGPRRRTGATPLVMFISDGGNTGPDPTPQINQLRAAGIRVISIGLSENVNIPLMQKIASSNNDYFYAPTTSELGWALQNVAGNVCRTIPPIVSAGGDQGAYEVRLPGMLTLQGEVHGAGPQGNFDVTSTWTQVSGPAPVTFVDPTSPTTQVLFTQPGTYVLQIETTDGSLTTASTTTVVVDPDPSIVGANLAIALTAPGPLTTGGTETATATLTDGNGVPIRNFIVQFTVGGANATTATVATNSAGVGTVRYVGQKAGTDVVKATALGSTFALDSSSVSVQWVDPIGSGPLLTQGWIGSPAHQSTVMGRVPVTLASTVNLASGTLTYWPSSNPSDTHVLTNTASGNAGASLATLDTTTLKNEAYILDLQGTDDHGNTQDNRVLVTVAGDYKPGRVVVDTTDFKLPLAGTPITIGRRYDSLDRNNVGDFGNGWSLAIGHPDLQVDAADNVTITMPNGRRVTFSFELVPPAAGPVVLGFLGLPRYVPEPGAFGTLTSDGCPVLAFDPGNPTPVCFGAIDTGDLTYAPTTYTYTDPSGIKYVMGGDGTLKSIADRSGNTLTFAANGIVSSRGDLTVQFTRDAQGRITQVTTPPFQTVNGFIVTESYSYTYDAAGNLATFVAPDRDNGPVTEQYQYNTDHLLTKTIDFNNHPARTSTYDADGRLLTDTDALGNVTSYAYDIPNHKTTTTYPDTGVVTDTFDDRGLLLSHKDQLNRVTTHVYDVNRNEIRRTNALNETTTYTYDANGNQTSSTNARGETTTTTYDAFSEPVSTTNPIGNTTTMAYDENGLPTSMADSMGILATFTSSERGLPLSVTDAAGKTVYMGYDAAGNLTARTDRLGRTTTSQYDGLGRRQATFDGRGGRTFNFYTAFGEISAVENPLGLRRNYHRDNNGNIDVDLGDDSRKQFTYVFDALNHVTKKTHVGDGSFVTYTRDFRGNVLTETDEAGHTTSYTYDLAGQLTKTTYADGTFASQTYDAVGRLSSKTDERANTTTYGYETGCDCAERLTTVTDPLNRTTTTAYDGMGRRTSVTDAANHTTSYVYDLRGHLTETDYADGTSTHDTYDAVGRRIASTDQMGATTTYAYDPEGQLTSVTDPLSNVTEYAYDANGNFTTITDANHHKTTYAYDATNRNTRRTLPLGMSETFTYNGDDDVSTHTDFRGKTTTMTYDRQDRLASKIPDASLGEPTVSYVTNANGTRASMVDASGTTTYTYDARNRLLTKATPEGTLTYSYDDSGNVASIGSSNANGTSVAFGWDAANQLASVTDNRRGSMTTASYTATGRRSTLNHPNGVGVTYAYDSLDRVLSMAWKKGTSPPLATFAYTYSPRGQRLTATDLAGRESAYGYDSASRLTSETVTGDPAGPSSNGALTYALDPAGNRLSRASTLGAFEAQSFSYDPNDELTTDSYDLNGNTTSSGGHMYAYDFENRLVSKDGGAIAVVYDGDGNRIQQTAHGVTTRYLVDDLNPTRYLQVLEELSGGLVQVRYTYGNGLLAQTRDASGTAATSYYGVDAHGSVAFLTDNAAVVTNSYTYEAWGNLVTSVAATPNTRLFAGEEADPDIGLVNVRQRQYQPALGRFVTIDLLPGELELSGSFNKYLYTINDPVDFADPLGLTEAAETAAIQSAQANSPNFVVVYRFIEDGTQRLYFGITNSLARRAAQHGTRILAGSLQALYAANSRLDARVIEQALIDKFGLSNLANKINSVADIVYDFNDILNNL